MDCATVFCDPDEEALLLSVGKPKARKVHKCTECKREVAKGEQYLSEKTLFDGNINTWVPPSQGYLVVVVWVYA